MWHYQYRDGNLCSRKCSPKWTNILGKIQKNFEGNFDPDTDKFSALDKLWPTRWTVWASCFQKIIVNYCLVLKLKNECLEESLDTKTRSRIIGCKAQMKKFNFFFRLCISQRHYSLTGNLSQTLQKEKMSAVGWQRLTSLTEKLFKIWEAIQILIYFTKQFQKNQKELMI